ncbi:MAG: response regulator transcription factor [Syntrophobacterales bacterium]
MNDYRIILAEDHVVFRRLLRQELENADGLTVVGEANNGQELLALLEQVTPDLIILDISMPTLNGMEAAKRIRVSHPHVKILFLSMHKNPAYAQQAQNLGVAGYLLKEEMEQALLAAIIQIRSGRPFFSPMMAQYLNDVAVKLEI